MPVKQCEQKNKNHTVIPTDAEKSFNKIQHPFMIKKKNNSSESGHRETYVNMIRPYMTNPQQILSSVVRTEGTSSEIRSKTRVSTLATVFNTVLKSQPQQSEKTNKGIKTGKEQVNCHCLQET